jgi:DNA-binding response OmpR family regulator
MNPNPKTTNARTVLLIDDDVELGTLLSDFLARYDIQCICAHKGNDALKRLREAAAGKAGTITPDLVILDIMLPDVSGLELCQQIRRESALPIVMLSARGEVYDRILGLELGADDYVAKPFEPRELLARIESVLRRQKPLPTSVLSFGNLTIHPQSEQALLDGVALELTHNEYRCLLYLAKNRQRILTRDLLLAELRGLDWELDNRSVDILISRLRRKLRDDPQSPRFIATIRGSGYRFVA